MKPDVQNQSQAKQSRWQQVVAQDGKAEFFEEIKPLLGALRGYIKRRLIMAQADGEIRTPLFNSNDLLDDTLLRAHEDFEKKPQDLTLDQWLYRIANKVIADYIRDRKADARRQSLERLREKELSTLEELPQLTADVEGERWLAEDLDDAEWRPRQFTPPAWSPPQPGERRNVRGELLRLLPVISVFPENERVIAELYLVEGFSEEDVAKICDVPVAEVKRVAERAKHRGLRAPDSQSSRIAS